MAITHGSTVYSLLHGVMEAPDWEVPVQMGLFPGVRGGSVMTAPGLSRPLACFYLLSGFVSKTLCRQAMDTINRRIGQDTGDITMTGTAADTFPKCTFLGFKPTDPKPRYDGSGVNGWFLRGRLTWIQRDPAAP